MARDTQSSQEELLCAARQLAAGVAHDINNVLLAISFSTDNLLEQCPEPDPRHAAVMEIREAAQQAADLAQRLLAFSQNLDVEFSSLNLPGIEQRRDAVSSPMAAVARCRDRSNSPSATTILLVEDESSLRLLLKRTLESQGYHVIEARHGPAAIAAAIRQSEPIDLLVTDIELPEMNGFELAEGLRGHYPAMATLYVSGSGSDCGRRESVRPSEAFLPKPFNVTELVAKVQSILPRS